MRLKDKTAIVTGAAHGIGRAIAEAFGREGAHVFIADLDVATGRAVANELRDNGVDGSCVRCDVTSKKDVQRLIATAMKQYGRVDVLCNNADYIAKKWNNAAEASEEE